MRVRSQRQIVDVGHVSSLGDGLVRYCRDNMPAKDWVVSCASKLWYSIMQNNYFAVFECQVNRIRSVDFVRVMAIFSVIIIHTNPFSKPLATGTPFDLGTLLTQLARFAEAP